MVRIFPLCFVLNESLSFRNASRDISEQMIRCLEEREELRLLERRDGHGQLIRPSLVSPCLQLKCIPSGTGSLIQHSKPCGPALLTLSLTPP